MPERRQPHEIVVADDGARRSFVTREIARRPRPRPSCLAPDEGFRLNRSRNNAIAVATGIISFSSTATALSVRVLSRTALAPRGLVVSSPQREHLLPKRRDYVLKTGDGSPFTPDTTKRLHSIRSRSPQITSKAGALDETLTMSGGEGRGANLGFWRSDAVKVNGFNEELVTGATISNLPAVLSARGRALQLEHLAVAYHFAHGENLRPLKLIVNGHATVVDGCRAPNGLGLDRAQRRH